MMRTLPCYLVIGENRSGRLVVRRVSRSWPQLKPREALIKVAFDLPNDIIDAPVHTIEIEAEDVTVGVEVAAAGGEE